MAHKISVTVSDEMKKRLDDYRFGNRIDRFQTAVVEILNLGLYIAEHGAQIVSLGDASTDPEQLSFRNEEDKNV